MSKTLLIGAIVASFLAVGTIAAVTATVIVNDRGGDVRVVRMGSLPAPGPGLPQPGLGDGNRQFGPGFGPMRRFNLQGLRSCMEKHGVVPGAMTPQRMQKMRDAMRACGGLLPALPELPR